MIPEFGDIITPKTHTKETWIMILSDNEIYHEHLDRRSHYPKHWYTDKSTDRQIRFPVICTSFRKRDTE